MNALATRSRSARAVALLLIPLLLAGGFLWGTWGAADRLHTVEAAVVNQDQMVELNGQPTPLGRQLAAELVDSSRDQNLTWVIADAAGARAGLESGRFAAVVTIPENFSATATSFSGAPADAAQATITVETSETIGISETALGQSIAAAAATSLNGFVTGEYLKGIYLGFNELGAQFVELRDGTAQLADGATQLADGATQSADGAGQLADGLGILSASGGALRSGAAQSAAGADQLADGAGALAAGATELAGGAGQLAAGVGQYAAGADTFNQGLTAYTQGVGLYTDGVSQYVGVINPIISQVRALVELLPEWEQWIDDALAVVEELPAWAGRIDAVVQRVVAGLRDLVGLLQGVDRNAESLDTAIAGYREALADPGPACPEELAGNLQQCEAWAAGAAAARSTALADSEELVDRSAQLSGALADLGVSLEDILAGAERLAELSSQFAAAAPGIRDQLLELTDQFGGTLPSRAQLLDLLDQFIAAGDQIVTAGDQLSEAGAQLADGGQQLADGAGSLAGGADQLAGGAGRLADGAGQFSGGTTQLADGLGQLSDGVGQYTGGVSQAAGGSTALADGLGQLADGAGQLASGTTELADGVAAGAGAIPTYTDSERETLARAAAAPIETETLRSIVQPRVSLASLLLVLALWLGSIAIFARVRPRDPRLTYSSASNAALLWDALRPGLALAAAQGALLAVLGAIVLGLPPLRALGLGVVLVLAGCAFAAVNQGLAALFGTGGRVAAVVFLMITAVPAVTSAGPATLDALRPLSPLSPALDAVRAVMTGGSAVIPALLLVGWLLAGLLGGAVAVARMRTVRAADLLGALAG